MSKPGGLIRSLSPKRSLDEPLDPLPTSPDLNKSSSNKRGWNFKRQKSILDLPDPTDEVAFQRDWGITLQEEVHSLNPPTLTSGQGGTIVQGLAPC